MAVKLIATYTLNERVLDQPPGRCGARWVENAAVFCQLPAGHQAEHYARCRSVYEDGRTIGFEIRWGDASFGKPSTF